jgi:hypothetical protein
VSGSVVGVSIREDMVAMSINIWPATINGMNRHCHQQLGVVLLVNALITIITSTAHGFQTQFKVIYIHMCITNFGLVTTSDEMFVIIVAGCTTQ